MNSPLANKMRPKTLDEMVGQKHLIGQNKPLRRIIESGNIPNLLFYGPSGVGKTTLASIIASQTNRTLYKLNGTTASTSDIKNIISETSTFSGMNGILLYLDEIQYFNKKQQQSLLEYIENGKITLIASTTENPYFYVYNAILSRVTVFEFKPIDSDEILTAVHRGFDIMTAENNSDVTIHPDVYSEIASSCGGDVRKALNAVELCFSGCPLIDGVRTITVECARNLSQKSSLRSDKSGDMHYDFISAFQKSMRGSDPDAAVHYLACILETGDLPVACRRLMICACEDVGLAYPQIIPIVKACVDIALQVGMPEARIPLADAAILVSNAPKSNSAYMAINKAASDVQHGKGLNVPRCLQNNHYDGDNVLEKGQNYLYPHDYPDAWTKQNYMPDDLSDTTYYNYGNNKNEQAFKAYWDKIKKL